MSDKNTGGPAFPVPHSANMDHNKGMTLRDYFAGQVLAGTLAGGVDTLSMVERLCKKKGCDATDDSVAFWAYTMADAMIAARDKEEKETT